MEYKLDWDHARENLIRWWNHSGLSIYLMVEREIPRFEIHKPKSTGSLKLDWIDPEYRLALSEYEMSWHDYYLEAFPYFDTQIGPGSLGIILGSKPLFVEDTVWYQPIIVDPDLFTHITFEPRNNLIWQQHLSVIQTGLDKAKERYLVGIPDLIENMDTLAALRGDQALLLDLTERQDWVFERLQEINIAYFNVFEEIYNLVKDSCGGNAFSAFKVWGPGKTAKIQCDISATLSPRMFRKFVFPFMVEQCNWLDYSLYHLDGTNCLQHLPILLEIPKLNAIEWTPQTGKPGGGSPEWFELYKQIKAGGKSIQAVGVEPDEVIPLLDSVGPAGLYILLSRALKLTELDPFLKAIEPYRENS